MEPITATALIVGGGAWIGDKILGPTAKIIGKDLKKLYEKGRDKIMEKSASKIPDFNDRKQSNLRVTRDVFWNGSFTDESICAEYFGGILASSRSEDGKDDSGIFYVDIIKSMSSGQLKMHYIIYRTFNKYFLADETKKGINPGQEDELNRENLFIPLLGIEQQLNQDLGAVLHGLAAKKLIGGFKTQNHIDGNEIMPYLKVSPTSLGIQLFAIANNKLEKWQRFAGEDFGDFRDIILPSIYASSLDSLSEKAGFKKLDSKN